MLTTRRLAVLLATLVALAAPSAALAQGAADDQYEDPFPTEPSDNGSSGGGGGGGSTGGGGGGGGGSYDGGSYDSGSYDSGAESTDTTDEATGETTSGDTSYDTGLTEAQAAAQPGDTTNDGRQLAQTGAETWLIGLAGLAMLLCGVELRSLTRPARD
jgi:hypothetical protein